MPRKWIDKKKATTFQLVYRPQNDPLIHDEDAPPMVLNPVANRGGSSKVKGLGDLASELGSDTASMRDNEGEAANYGIYYDDTEYDYMQHLRDLNSGGGEAVWVEATTAPANKKGKGKSLEVALREMELEETSNALLDKDVLPSQNLQQLSYQSQQDVPDAIGGFQPDMDPRLREVLEALEDEAYVDDDEDVFQELAKDAREISRHEFEEEFFDEDEEGWESDDTAKPTKEFEDEEVPQLVSKVKQAEAAAKDDGTGSSEDWMEDFNKFKKEQKTAPKARAAAVARSELQSSIFSTTTNGGRKKKRKGAMTNPSTYSMSSSVLSRTEQLQMLDARFEKLQEKYDAELDDDDDGAASMSAVSTASSVQGPLRSDFDGILDEFLGNYTKPTKRTSKKARAQSGIEQLDEIRKGLGPARIQAQK